MSSISSSDSYNDALIKQKAELITENKKMKSENQKLQLQAEGLEHDLQIAQQAFSFAGSTMISRTKRFATLFGCMLKSDEELIQKIQALIKSAEDDERKAIELKNQIDMLTNTQAQDDSKINDAMKSFKFQQSKTSEKQSDLNDHVKILDDINKQIIIEEQNKRDLMTKYQPLADLLNAKSYNGDFFAKLQQKYNSIDPKAQRALSSLADAAGIELPDFNDFNIGQFLDTISYQYEKLQSREQQQSQLNQAVLDRLQRTKDKINEKKKKLRILNEYVNSATNQIAKKNDDFQQASQMRNDEVQSKIMSLQTKERKNLTSVFLFTNQNADPNQISVDDIIQNECSLITETAEKLVKARQEKKEKVQNSAAKLQKGICVIENAADVLSVANRRLMRNIIPKRQ